MSVPSRKLGEADHTATTIRVALLGEHVRSPHGFNDFERPARHAPPPMNLSGRSAKLAAEQLSEQPHREDGIDPVDPRVLLIRVAGPGMNREA
jgi:hypothetical protein